MTELTVLGIVLKDETVPVLLLHPQHTALVLQMPIGAAEAYAISTVLYEESSLGFGGKGRTRQEGDTYFSLLRQEAEKEKLPPRREGAPLRKHIRPLTHDLALELVAQLDGKLLAVEITHVHMGEFFAELVFRGIQGIRRVACRPADGIALAVRCDAAVRCQDGVLALADDMQPVLENLPETVRGYALSALARQLQAGAVGEDAPQGENPPLLPRKKVLEKKELVLPPKKVAVKQGSVITIEVGKTRQGESPAREAVQNLMATLQVAACAVPSFTLPQPNDRLVAPARNTPEETRWRVLLQLLLPETKVPM